MYCLCTQACTLRAYRVTASTAEWSQSILNPGTTRRIKKNTIIDCGVVESFGRVSCLLKSTQFRSVCTSNTRYISYKVANVLSPPLSLSLRQSWRGGYCCTV